MLCRKEPCIGAQSLEPLGPPPATDAPQVTAREGFTPSPPGSAPFTRVIPQCPERPSPSCTMNHQPQATLTLRLGDPSGVDCVRPPLSLLSASPELKGGGRGGLWDELAGRAAETHSRPCALSPGHGPLDRVAPSGLGGPPCFQTTPPHSRHRPGPQVASPDHSGTRAQHSGNCSSVKEHQP